MRQEPTGTNGKEIHSTIEQADRMSRPTCDKSVAETAPSDMAARPEREECVVDFKWLINRIEDEEIVEQIMPLCIDDNRRNLEMLGEAVSRGDSEKIRNRAHSIRGSAVNMGAVRLAGPAGRLECLALKGDLSEADDLLGQIRTEFEKLEAFVANPNWIEEAVRISGDQDVRQQLSGNQVIRAERA